MSPSTYYLTIICCLLPSYVVSLALNAASSPDGSLTLTQPSRLMNLNTTTLTEGKIDCDQTRFGNPPSASCEDAMALLPRDAPSLFRRVKRSYGPRTQGNWDVNLPSRLISPDGKCIIDYTQTSSPSHVLNGDLLAAAIIIQQECIDKDVPPWGGQARDMGDEGNFLFTVQAYTPPFIRCANTPPAQRPATASCQTILNTMKASDAKTTFGAAGVPDVDETLPRVLTEPTGQCTITIDTTAPDDVASWYDLWQAAVALDGMCARGGRTGKARFLGDNRKLTVEVKKA